MTSNIQGQYAGAVTRGVAFSIDLLIIAVTVAISSWLVKATVSFVGINVQQCDNVADLFSFVCNATRVVMALYAALFAPVYAIFFWTFGGQTIGMNIMGIRVVRTDGNPLNLVNSLFRLIGFALCILTLGIGFAKMLIDNQRQGMHDSMAGTFVIYAWRGEQNMNVVQRVQARLNRKKKTRKAVQTDGLMKYIACRLERSEW